MNHQYIDSVPQAEINVTILLSLNIVSELGTSVVELHSVPFRNGTIRKARFFSPWSLFLPKLLDIARIAR